MCSPDAVLPAGLVEWRLKAKGPGSANPDDRLPLALLRKTKSGPATALHVSDEDGDLDFEELRRAQMPIGFRSRQHFTGPGAGNSSKNGNGFV
jgi:hypothetical protein